MEKKDKFVYVMKLACAVMNGVISYMATIFMFIGMYVLDVIQKNNGTVVDLTGDFGEKMLFINVNVLAISFFMVVFLLDVICFVIKRGESIGPMIMYYSTVLALCFVAKRFGIVVETPLQFMSFEIVCAFGGVCVILKIIMGSVVRRLTAVRCYIPEPCESAVRID